MKEFTRETVWDLRGNRTNVILSFSALFTALLMLILTAVLSAVGTDSLVARSEQLNGRPVTYTTALTTHGWSTTRTETIVTAIAAWSHDSVTGSLVMDRTVTTHPMSRAAGTTPNGPLRLRTVSPGYPAIRRLPLTAGRWFSNSVYPGEAVVNAAAAAQLGSRGTIPIHFTGFDNPMTITVVGTVSDGSPDPTVYSSVDTFADSTLLPPPDQVTVLLHGRTLTSDRASDLVTATLARAGVQDSPDVGRADQAQQIADSLTTVKLVFLVLAAAALAVAVLGMINVGIANIRERARDLTIRRAMGATRLRIAASVAAGALTVGVSATAAAAATSLALVHFAVPALITPTSGIAAPSYPWATAAGAACIGIVASLISGLIPALRTRSLDLAQALRA